MTIGSSPYHLQRLNASTSLGQLVITHRPQKTPLWHSGFQLVVGAASASCYSVTVTARVAEAANVVVGRHMARAKQVQAALPDFDRKLEDAWTSMRLSERKLMVLQEMMDEAEAESARTEREISECNEELQADETNMQLSDKDRLDLFNEVRVWRWSSGTGASSSRPARASGRTSSRGCRPLRRTRRSWRRSRRSSARNWRPIACCCRPAWAWRRACRRRCRLRWT